VEVEVEVEEKRRPGPRRAGSPIRRPSGDIPLTPHNKYFEANFSW